MRLLFDPIPARRLWHVTDVYFISPGRVDEAAAQNAALHGTGLNAATRLSATVYKRKRSPEMGRA
jgi:hypothetical protein